jgi:hypothetical protein
VQSFDDVTDEVLADLGQLRNEARIIYQELVLTGWGSHDRHGYPRTLYGYTMNAFAFIDLLSAYQLGQSTNQTARMAAFMTAHLEAAEPAAAVAVKLWRHTLMHTANPRVLLHRQSQRRFRWLLHWRDHLPRENHMSLVAVAGSNDEILNIAVMYLIEDLEQAAVRLFVDLGKTPHSRNQLITTHAALSQPDDLRL